MKKTNTRNRKQGRNKFSPIDCMSDTFVLEKRELMAGGAPPAVIFKITAKSTELFGLWDETIQNHSWEKNLIESDSLNESLVIQATGIKDFWKPTIVGNISGEASIILTKNDNTLEITHKLSQIYTPNPTTENPWPFGFSSIFQQVMIYPYLLGESHTWQAEISSSRETNDNDLNGGPGLQWNMDAFGTNIRDQTTPFVHFGRLNSDQLEFEGYKYSYAGRIWLEGGAGFGVSSPPVPYGEASTVLTSTITIKDLTLPDIAISNATYDDVNKNVWFDMELKNNPKDFNVKLYQSEDQSFDESDDFVSSQSISSSSYSSQKNSVSVHLPDSFKYNPLKPYLVLVADPWSGSTPRGEVTELEEKSNNVTSVMIMPSTDIKVTKLSFVSRGVLEVEYDITGDIPVQHIIIRVYRSESASFAYGKNQVIASYSVSPSSRKVTIKGDFRIDPSRRFILAVADPENLIDENDSDPLNEDNSKSIRKFLLGAITHGYSITLFNYTSIDWMKRMRDAMLFKGYDSVFTHDWYEASDDTKRNVTVNEGYKFAQKIIAEAKRLTFSATSINGYESNFLVDLHLIGHSRGAVVVTQAAIKLSNNPYSKFLFDHKKLTLLDPHPANRSTLNSFNVPSRDRVIWNYWGLKTPIPLDPYSISKIMSAIKGSIRGYQSFCLKARDPNIEIPSFIDEAESYYQRSEVVLPLKDLLWVMNLHGIPVKGAKNTEITSLRPVIQHSDVYNWYINNKISKF
jgi:hypothetical protein